MARRVVPLLLLLPLTLALPACAADVVEVTDPAGDAQLYPGLPGDALPWAPAFDLVTVDVHDETDTTLALTLQVADLGAVHTLDGDPESDGIFEARFKLSSYTPTMPGDWTELWMPRADYMGGAWRFSMELPCTADPCGGDDRRFAKEQAGSVDEAASTITFLLDRAVLGAPPAGTVMSEIQATAQAVHPAYPVYDGDWAPDAKPEATYVFTRGPGTGPGRSGPGSLSQPDGAELTVYEDPAGDTTRSDGKGVSGPMADAVDLRLLTMTSSDTLRLTLKVTGLGATTAKDDAPYSIQWAVGMTVDGLDGRMQLMAAFMPVRGADKWAYGMYDTQGVWHDIQGSFDAGTGTITILAPWPGCFGPPAARHADGVQAWASQTRDSPQVGDRMGDQRAGATGSSSGTFATGTPPCAPGSPQAGAQVGERGTGTSEAGAPRADLADAPAPAPALLAAVASLALAALARRRGPAAP